jgi:hypothetical protein
MTGWRGGVKHRLGLQIRTQARRLVYAHFASQLGIMQPASVAQRSGTIWTPTPFWCFGSVTAVATTRRGRLLKTWLAIHSSNGQFYVE